jgi:hypothetical protein
MAVSTISQEQIQLQSNVLTAPNLRRITKLVAGNRQALPQQVSYCHTQVPQ